MCNCKPTDICSCSQTIELLQNMVRHLLRAKMGCNEQEIEHIMNNAKTEYGTWIA